MKTSEKKARQYREIIVKLKEEFIKSEEERAKLAIKGVAGRDKDGTGGGGGAVNAEELSDLRRYLY